MLLAACVCALATLPTGRSPAHATEVGGKLLIAHDHALDLRDLAGGEERTLVSLGQNDFVFSPAWLPDGSGFVYVDQHLFTGDLQGDWGSDLWQADADGGNRRRLWTHDARGAEVDGIALAPDGRWLLFGYIRSDISPSGVLLGQSIRVNRLDLASGAVTPFAEGAVDPAIAADGATVAYIDIATPSGSPNLWLRGADGANPRLLYAAAPALLSLFQPRFSPDGATLLITAAPDPTRSGGFAYTGAAHGLPEDIWAVRTDGGGGARLTTLQEDQPSSAWSSDGQQALVLGSGGLYLLEPRDAALTRIGEGVLHGQIAWLEQ